MVNSERSKRLKASKGSSSGIDRISDLPDSLISHVLSLLPTKCAVATSVLSTGWKFRWTSITNLDFDNYVQGFYISKEELEMKQDKFTEFVNKVLLLHNPPFVQNFRFKIGQKHFEPTYIHSWIRVAIGRTVRELDLSLKLEDRIELPLDCICCNVAVLKLEGDIHFNIPAAASVCFPNLNIMHLKYVMFANDDSCHKLLSSCPILDNLIFEIDDFENVLHLSIHIPSLTRLTLGFTAQDTYPFQVLIDTPALQYLDIYDDLPCEYLPAKNLSSLLQANFSLNYIYEEDVEKGVAISKFIESLSNVKYLSVSGEIPKAIKIASTNISPSFHNLTRLEFKDHYCADLFGVINNFLDSMNHLEHLVVKGTRCYKDEETSWTEPLNVPKCLRRRVTTVSFDYDLSAANCHNQLELLRYFLKNSNVLQLLTITTHPTSEKKRFELLQKISMFPRGSKTCQVAFT